LSTDSHIFVEFEGIAALRHSRDLINVLSVGMGGAKQAIFIKADGLDHRALSEWNPEHLFPICEILVLKAHTKTCQGSVRLSAQHRI